MPQALLAADQTVRHPNSEAIAFIQRHWFILLAAAVAASPGVISLARNYWSTEQGAAGPIVLLTGVWLLRHEAAGMQVKRDRAAAWIVPLALIAVGSCTVVAAVTVKQWLQLLGIYLSLLLLLYGTLGWRQFVKLRIPILYLAFIIPPPDYLAVPLTRALKEFVAGFSVDALALMGFPAARDGVLLYMGQYELVVAAACSGMNSIFSLTAIGLFYVYMLHRSHTRYAVLLCTLMIPIALFANVVRVMSLLLLTYYGGEAVGQGILHEVAGIFIFIVALVTLIALDRVLAPIALKREVKR